MAEMSSLKNLSRETVLLHRKYSEGKYPREI